MTKEKKELESKVVIVDTDCAHHWERNRQYRTEKEGERERERKEDIKHIERSYRRKKNDASV
jgi:hypothetical protein